MIKLLTNVFIFRCKAKECQFGYVFNYNLGDCEKIICKRGYEIDQSGKCVGK
jgi:hypothetical protein